MEYLAEALVAATVILAIALYAAARVMSGGAAERLERLAKLKQNGDLSEEEFNRIKKRLLARV